MRFPETVRAIMKHNLNDFFHSGDPDVIYSFLTAELLECEPADLLLLHDLLIREVANETDTSTGGLSALTKGFYGGLRDVLYGILAERIEEYKKDEDFYPLGQILTHALETDQKVFHEIGQLVYHDGYSPEIIERAKKSKMSKYRDEIEQHLVVIKNKTEERGENVESDPQEYPEWYHPVTAEIRLIHLIDVASCYYDANPMNFV